MPRRALWSLAAAAGLWFAPPLAPRLAAQVTVLDEGTFTLLHAGTRVGREDFSIRAARSAAGEAGAAIIAQGTVLAGERRVTVALHVDSLGRPVRFQRDERVATDVIEQYLGRRERGVWSGRAVRLDGESARESPLGDVLLVEPDIVHHLWFALRFGPSGTATLLTPRSGTLEVVQIAADAPDTITIGSRDIPAQRWIVQLPGDTVPRWELWADAQGRLLRVRDRRRGVEAVRDEPPTGFGLSNTVPR